MHTIHAPMDLDGAFTINKLPLAQRLTPARYARDVAAAFPELGRNGTEDMGAEARRWSVNTHGISPVEAERLALHQTRRERTARKTRSAQRRQRATARKRRRR